MFGFKICGVKRTFIQRLRGYIDCLKIHTDKFIIDHWQVPSKDSSSFSQKVNMRSPDCNIVRYMCYCATES